MKSSSSSSSLVQDKLLHYWYCKKERCLIIGKFLPLLLSFLGVATIFSLFILYLPYPLRPPSKHAVDTIRHQKEDGKCDLFKGHWVPDFGGPPYTNSSCGTIPSTKNCFLQGRKDRDFLNWRWKPDECELPRFDPKVFLENFRGKKMAFIGDSVARNHMESLLCQLSQEETPLDAYKDAEDRFRVWHFPNSKFTLMILWTKFLVAGQERVINGSPTNDIFDLHLDKMDEKWVRDLPTIDIAVLSDGHWFFRQIFLHRADKVIGCIYCDEPNVTRYEPDFAFRMIFRSALNYINECKTCRGILTVLRTFSPAHFESGSWNSGGVCNRTSPLGERDIDMNSFDWRLRGIQVEEIERVAKGGKSGKRFEALDITRAMMMRPDGHPGTFWGNKWMKGYNDCVHWCLPGPIDAWNDFLIALLGKKKGSGFWTS